MNFLTKSAPLAFSLCLLAGCATLPQAGPTGERIVHESQSGAFTLKEVNGANELPSPPEIPSFNPLPPGFASDSPVLVEGDVISAVYYEVGARLFSGTSGNASGTFDPNAKGTQIGPVTIDPDGKVRLPYTGEMRAAGLTTRELGMAIESRLRSKSENPQVLVRLDAANGSSVIVGGEIGHTGRVPLTSAHEKLLDIISLAGGPRGAPETLMVRVDRRGLISEGPLESLTYQNFGGTMMEAGDRILLMRKPWTYSVLGSANRINRFDLPLRPLSLIEALALAGGPSEYTANPGAVFVFRNDADPGPAPGGNLPTVYHLNMMKASSYLLAQRFYLTDKDVVYVAGAEANQPSKLLQIIGQIFSPIAVARQATN